ncbi:alpha/beta hydrolase [Ectothiorhodospira lacustris]|uniref:alpha/beta hydrolase n=1 Tax=Ectothiorhodospira lacustris TaxID=2899127 RepID=UPI001EE973D8|nr:alpha/beta hydrolase [Ectothiorhodospira lacustris]MCG5509797.1 carboxylesterase [Ectothiorhodospira lacustris]MCG5522289.1 carboxylesterase [Ectothiorhodospira lacustris]
MKNTSLDTVVIDTGASPRSCVIWLHGLGADGHDFEPIVPELSLPPGLPVRFLFPHAPMRRVTINNHMPMRAWYDFLSLDPGRGEDHAQVAEAVSLIQAMVETARRDHDRVLLGGFSQGGAVALLAGLSEGPAVDGIFALSTYMPDARQAGVGLSQRARGMPVFMGHGSADPVIPVDFGRHTSKLLDDLGAVVQWHEYPMPHSVCADEIRDLSSWFAGLLA